MEAEKITPRSILAMPGKYCADCEDENPTYCNLIFGCYLCIQCAFVHKTLPKNMSNVKSLQIDIWSENEIRFVTGNQQNAILEKYMPFIYPKPNTDSILPLRYEFIHDKYERKLFTSNQDKILKENNFLRGEKSGDLNSGKVNYFKLKKNMLECYDYSCGSIPKYTLNVEYITFSLEASQGPYILKINKNNKPKSKPIKLFSPNVRETVEWYYALCMAKYSAMLAKKNKIDFYTSGQEAEMRGLLGKSGPKENSDWRERWVMLEGNTMRYYDIRNKSFWASKKVVPKGEVKIGLKSEGYGVIDNLNQHKCNAKTPYTFCLITPGRSYNFYSMTETEKYDWIRVFDRIINPHCWIKK